MTGFAGATNGPTASIAASGAGTFSVRLTVTDNTGLAASVVTRDQRCGRSSRISISRARGGTRPAGSESGWGINFAHQGDMIFATWFTHDVNGRAWQLSMTATQTGPNTFAGTIFRTTGPPLDALPFDPAHGAAHRRGVRRR